ncbi:LD-carboxypeptidase [uncultured Cellulomonas sp.]|uniref:S66 family peptidase n=1 Tax=uncultured Cellulomonas sp. TaxID=189682 RepID=UPI0028E832DA|nr:LD-carboxypeptidase [uncultured Cellulomonas sp.]
MISYPRALAVGDVIGVAAPSAGIGAQHAARLDVAVRHLSSRGFPVRLGSLVRRDGIAAGSAAERAEELMGLMLDPTVRAVVPPWGGHLALALLPSIDFDALAADPTWLVGYSDISTLLLPLTLLTGVASLHGQNLMDTPFRVPAPMASWLDVVRSPPGAVITQGSAPRFRRSGFADFAAEPGITEYVLDTPGRWSRVDATGDVQVSGRLLGGCLETVSHLAGTPYGDVEQFAVTHAPEGLIVYLESSGSDAAEVARRLLGLRYAGWFTRANAVLLGRSRGADLPGLSQHEAVGLALRDLGIPVLVDVDCGHVPPHLSLVNGALATLDHSAEGSTITQQLS